MTSYLVGADHSGNDDQGCIDKVCEILEGAGHSVKNLGVDPNLEGTFRNHGKGNTGVFIVNGMCIGTFDSFRRMVEAGGLDFMIMAFPQSISPSNDWISCESLKSRKLPIAHDDNFTPADRRAELDGKYTCAEYCQEHSQYMAYVCGDDCEAVANAILEGNYGGGGGSSDSSEENDSEPTPMSYKDMILDLISVWDGDVECKVRQDKLYINKVPKPNPELWIVEGNNIVSGNAKTSDYHSDTINTLHVTYNDKTITITDEYLINRFGVVEETIPAVEIVTDYSGDSTDGTTTGITDGTGGGTSDGSNQYRTIAGILQKYMTSNDWNSYINSVRKCTTRDQVKNLIVGHKKKDGVKARNNLIITEICEALKIET